MPRESVKSPLEADFSRTRDDERNRKLRVAGYSVVRITWNQLDDEPTKVATDLRILLLNDHIKSWPAGQA